MSCGYSTELLLQYMDGRAAERTQELSVHIAQCSRCTTELSAHKAASQKLVELVDRGVGEVDPLAALAKIHARIREQQEQSWLAKLKRGLEDLFTFQKKLVWGVAAAAALGALASPVLVLWAKRAVKEGGPGTRFATVVIESMQVEGNARTVVYRGESSDTTLIWVEPNDAGSRYH